MNFFSTSNPHMYIAIILSVLNGGILAFISAKFLQVIQQSGYKMQGFYTWLRGTRYKYLSRLFSLSLLSVFCAVVTIALLDVYSEGYFSYSGLIFYFYFSAIFIFNLVKEPNKLPLVRTKRIGRIFSLLFLLFSLATFFLIALSTEYLPLIKFSIITLTPILIPFFVIFAFYLILPIELMINKYYITRAKNKLKKNPNLIKVAITGSYAKTTVKFILQKMIEKKYITLSSPHSYNTPLGLTRVILKDLKPNHQIFIAEFGAKKVNEIKELCHLIKPNHGILTSIGSQHLETFKTQENIIKTKLELADYIKDGYMIFNGDSKFIFDYYKDYQNTNKMITYAENPNGFAHAKDIFLNQNGINFTLVIDDSEVKCKTKLLGKHSLQNIALCAAMAYKLGVSLSQIQEAISELVPFQHRMEILPAKSDMIIIDDSFNASSEGCEAALEVLKEFKDYQKIIITPGIVEMGKLDTTANYEFGKQIAKVCDKVIIVNDINLNSITKGLLENNFDNNSIFKAENLTQAQNKLQEIAKEKCVVLFENDLPDLFVY